MFRVILLFSILSGSLLSSAQNNWPQYLGPDRNATIKNVSIAESWPDAGPKKLWSIPLGSGYGGASIYENEVFVLDRIVGQADVLRCLDLNSGEEKWTYQYEAPGELPYPGSRTVPTVDENYIWMVGPHGHMNCIDKKTLRPIWSKNIHTIYDAQMPNWGISQSPLLYKNLVIVAPQGSKAGCVAFNKTTGEVVWESRALTGYTFYVSPTVATIGGIDQVIMTSPYSKEDSTKIQEVVAFNAQTGKELWTYKGLKSFATITPPTIIGDNKVFLTDCSYNDKYAPVSVLIEINKTENGFQVNEIFKTEEAGCKMHPPVFRNNYLYLNSNGRPNQMVCMSLTGELQWEKGSAPEFEMGAVIQIGDYIVNQNGKNGAIHLIKPSPDGYKELAKAELFNSTKSQAWAPMAFANGKLIVRDMEQMICVDLQNP